MPRRVWFPLLPLALALMSLIPAARGAGAVEGIEQTLARGVVLDATAESSQRKLVVDRRGALYLAYVRPVDGVPQIILASSSDGGRSWRHAQVTRSTSLTRFPSLAVFPDGTLHLVWTEFAPIGRVWYRFLRRGQWSQGINLSQPGIYAGVPVVAPVRGQPHVLWYGIRPEAPRVSTRHESIYEILSTYATNGGVWTTPSVISSGAAPDSVNPSLGATDDNRLQAAWFQLDGPAYQVRSARFDVSWLRPHSVTAGRLNHTRVALAADGRDVHLVWEEDDSTPHVMYRPPEGGAAVRLSGPMPAHDPVIAASGGVVVAAWSEGQTIMLRRLRPLGPSRALGTGRAPAIAVHQNIAYVAWTYAAGTSPELRFATVRLR